MSAALIGVSSGFTDYGDYLGVAFARPLERLGANVVTLPYAERPESLLPHLDGLLLAGGRDIEPARFGGVDHSTSTRHSPLRDQFELALAPAAISAGIPLLGICRGMQIVNVALGGTLELDHGLLPPPATAHPGGDWDRWREVVRATLGGWSKPEHPSHEVAIAPGSRLADALGDHAVVNSYHHQSLARLGRDLVVTARAPDGVVEAIELPRAASLCLAVQWEEQEHPGTPLFAMLVRAAHEHAASGPRDAADHRRMASVKEPLPARRASG
ncbi:MAG: gamma-glutamyl-gamma-aminobutyrate hydrolase family protein [Solirubrobacteraceae bacterium]